MDMYDNISNDSMRRVPKIRVCDISRICVKPSVSLAEVGMISGCLSHGNVCFDFALKVLQRCQMQDTASGRQQAFFATVTKS